MSERKYTVPEAETILRHGESRAPKGISGRDMGYFALAQFIIRGLDKEIKQDEAARLTTIIAEDSMVPSVKDLPQVISELPGDLMRVNRLDLYLKPLGVMNDELEKLADISTPSLNTPVGEDVELGDLISGPDGNGVENAAIGSVVGEEIRKLYDSCLTPKEARILELRFQRGMTLVEIGRTEGVTRERIRQIEVRALKKMRLQAENKGFREYLR